MITPGQCRAARAWLGWTQQDLADLAIMAVTTVKDFETAKREPKARTVLAIKQTLEAAGMVFPAGDIVRASRGVEEGYPRMIDLAAPDHAAALRRLAK